MGRKRKTIRLEPENEQYLRRIAWEQDRSINWLVNQIVEERRRHSDSNMAATPCASDKLQ